MSEKKQINEDYGYHAEVKRILEVMIMTASMPLSLKDMQILLKHDYEITTDVLQELLSQLILEYQDKGFNLVQKKSGYIFETASSLKKYVFNYSQLKPIVLSKATLETIAIIVYRQPVTRIEIENIRGVSVSSNIIKTLQERNWIKIIGHKNVPGKPALFATTKQLLDDLHIKSLSDLPPLGKLEEIKNDENAIMQLVNDVNNRGAEQKKLM